MNAYYVSVTKTTACSAVFAVAAPDEAAALRWVEKHKDELDFDEDGLFEAEPAYKIGGVIPAQEGLVEP